jgi:FkbM family methyltransferase
MNLKQLIRRCRALMSSGPQQDRLNRIERKLDLLEFYSHGSRAVYLGGRRVLLKAVVFGANIAFILESDDRLLAPWFIVSGQYETSLTNWLVPRLAPDSRCIDVGANFGYFTCVFARFCPNGSVIGVEPDPEVFRILRDNVLINGFEGHACVLNNAIADTNKPLTLYRRNTRSGNTSIIQASDAFTATLGEEPAQPFVMDALTVDRICSDIGGRVDFLKIDVEGAEPLVMRGARSTIESNADIKIIMEWSPDQIRAAGFDLSEFLAEMKDCGLSAFALSEAGEERKLEWEALLSLPYMAGVVLHRD